MAQQLLRKFNLLFFVLLFVFLLSLAASFYLFSCEDDWCFYFDWQRKRQVLKQVQKPVLSIFKNIETEFSPAPVTLESVFDSSHDWTATLSANRVRVMVATGDVLPARAVNYNIAQKENPLWPYEKVAPFIRGLNPDITFINLETPLIQDCPLTQVGMIFCGDSKNIDGILSVGTNVATLANNHIGNYGADGIRQTVDLLQRNGILTTGVRESLAIKEISGVKFAFLGYSDIGCGNEGISCAEEGIIRSEISQAKNQADIVVVAFHFGAEYRSQPDNRQIALAHFAIDAGADVVTGNHPHWIQPIELYKGKFITYAHGNFVFDQMWSLKTRQGVVGKYVFYDNKLIDVEFFPVLIEDYGQPYFLEADEKKKILDEMYKESTKLAESMP